MVSQVALLHVSPGRICLARGGSRSTVSVNDLQTPWRKGVDASGRVNLSRSRDSVRAWSPWLSRTRTTEAQRGRSRLHRERRREPFGYTGEEHGYRSARSGYDGGSGPER